MKLKKLFKRIKKLMKKNNYKIKVVEEIIPGEFIYKNKLFQYTIPAGLNIKVKLRKK